MIETTPDLFWAVFLSATGGAWFGTYCVLYQFYAISKRLENAPKNPRSMIVRIAITGPFAGYFAAMVIYWPGRYFLGVW